MKKNVLLFVLFFYAFSPCLIAQVNEDKLGAWYIYVWNKKINTSQFGVKGDFQLRNWDLGNDVQQLLLRGGLSYKPKKVGVTVTVGYGNITSYAYGESTSSVGENRVYQEVIFPSKVGGRVLISHRFRYEQRFIENQDMRTRYRYNLSFRIPLNKSVLEENTFYLALYNEIFINGQEQVGNGLLVEKYDRNRTYAALGYKINDALQLRVGVMNQTTADISKNQLQLSAHHSF
ncbi:MAG: DUF2490 domain-containing protein [Cyclobacteriaceae bacterium]